MIKRNIFKPAILVALFAATAILPSAPMSIAAPSSQPQIGPSKRDVTYCTAGGVELKLDVYLPKAGSRPAPAVLYLHGGSWVSGDKWEIGLAANQLTSRGYVVASANYRLAPQYKWPAQIEDAKCVVRYLRANASLYNLDPDRIGVWGSSAGGHLAALLGLAGPEAGFEGRGGYAGQSSRVQAVVDMFGPTDLTAYDPNEFALGIGDAVFGVKPGQSTEVLEKASPVNYVTEDAPPFLLLHGDKDDLVPLSQSEKLRDKLQVVGAPVTLVVVKNADHGFVPKGGLISPSIVEIGATILDFFDRKLGNAPASPLSATFPQTGKTVSGAFLQYWNAHGGLAQQGYPISEEMQELSVTDGKTYTVQYFERAQMELHPENAPPSNILLSLLGVQQYAHKYPGGAGGQSPNTGAGSILFPETGKRVGGPFLSYWKANGGLAQYGYPISEEFTETSEIDGKPYKVQYFERAVFELHPENKPPYDVLLSQLGTLRYRTIYPGAGLKR